MASSVCRVTLTVPACSESMFVYVPEATAPHVEIRVSVCEEDSFQKEDSVAP